MSKKKIAALLRSLWWHHDVAMRAADIEQGWGHGTITRRVAANRKKRHTDAFAQKVSEALSRYEEPKS